MDEESLFRDIHRHLLKRAKEAGAVDTEATLAEKFNVSRYRVRRVLDKLAQMGIVSRAQKRGVTVLPPNPKFLANNIEELIGASNYDVRELLEARSRTEADLIPLVIRRLTPVLLGHLEEKIPQMQTCIEFHGAALKLHLALHRELLEAAGNRILQAYSEALLNVLEHFFNETPDIEHDFIVLLVSADDRLVDALRREDLPAAREAFADMLLAESRAVLEAVKAVSVAGAS